MIFSKYDTLQKRLAASLIDGVVMSILSIVLVIVVGYVLSLVGKLFPNFAIVAMIFVIQFYGVLYVVLMHGWCGQTVGKAIMGIEVVKFGSETQISYGQSFLRESPYFLLITISFFLALLQYYLGARNSPLEVFLEDFAGIAGITWFVLEMITMLTNSQRRALHDFIGKTVVVRET